jgi:hypothetical protein
MLESHETEAALAEEAAAHARASAELNSFGEAEAVEIGSARLVYAGVFASVHGVYGLGLDGPVEERDWAEIDRFFQKKERAPVFYVAPFTDPGLEARLIKTHRLARIEKVCGWELEGDGQLMHEAYLSGPDHGEWSLAFARSRNPSAKEADLLSATKLHQKNTRFYLQAGAASYTFFHRGVAVVPYPAGNSLLALQKKEAEAFRCKAFVVMDVGTSARSGDNFADTPAPILYERKVYEPVRS